MEGGLVFRRRRACAAVIILQRDHGWTPINTDAAPVKLTETWVRVPPVELDCSRRNMNSTAPPRGGVGS